MKKIFTILLAMLALVVGVNTASAETYTRDLAVGSSGSDVTALQTFLVNQGYLVLPGGPGSMGTFGRLTKTALIKFQISAGMTPADGFFGPLTRDYVNDLFTGKGFIFEEPSIHSVVSITNKNNENILYGKDSVRLYGTYDQDSKKDFKVVFTSKSPANLGDEFIVKAGLDFATVLQFVMPNIKNDGSYTLHVKNGSKISNKIPVTLKNIIDDTTVSDPIINSVRAKAGLDHEIYPGEIIDIEGEYFLSGNNKDTKVFLNWNQVAVTQYDHNILRFKAPSTLSGDKHDLYVQNARGTSNHYAVWVPTSTQTPSITVTKHYTNYIEQSDGSRLAAVSFNWNSNTKLIDPWAYIYDLSGTLLNSKKLPVSSAVDNNITFNSQSSNVGTGGYYKVKVCDQGTNIINPLCGSSEYFTITSGQATQAPSITKFEAINVSGGTNSQTNKYSYGLNWSASGAVDAVIAISCPDLSSGENIEITTGEISKDVLCTNNSSKTVVVSYENSTRAYNVSVTKIYGKAVKVNATLSIYAIGKSQTSSPLATKTINVEMIPPGQTVTPPTSSITVTSPTKSSSVTAGGKMLVKATHTDFTNTDNVKVTLESAGKEPILLVKRTAQVCIKGVVACTNLLTNTGVTVTIPATTATGVYTIKVVVTKPDGTSATDESEPFTILSEKVSKGLTKSQIANVAEAIRELFSR
jgi:hypothetical protein